MNINGNDVKNILSNENKRLLSEFIKIHIRSIEKKILIASKNGYDYIWYKITEHFKYNNDKVCSKIIKTLEKNKFHVRLFENNLLEVIW